MKITIHRDGQQRYYTYIAEKRVNIWRSTNPTCLPCFRWSAASTEVVPSISVRGFTLTDIRQQLESIEKHSMTKQEAYELIDAYEADPSGVKTCDNLCTVLDSLPNQPDEGEYNPDEVRAMVDEQLGDE